MSQIAAVYANNKHAALALSPKGLAEGEGEPQCCGVDLAVLVLLLMVLLAVRRGKS